MVTSQVLGAKDGRHVGFLAGDEEKYLISRSSSWILGVSVDPKSHLEREVAPAVVHPG